MRRVMQFACKKCKVRYPVTHEMFYDDDPKSDTYLDLWCGDCGRDFEEEEG